MHFSGCGLLIKLQPGCYFVHQNVPAVNATDKMLYGYKKLQEQLDAMTVAAAEEENASDIQSHANVSSAIIIKSRVRRHKFS